MPAKLQAETVPTAYSAVVIPRSSRRPNTRTSGFPVDRLEGSGVVEYAIDHLPLLPGRYLVSAAVYDEDLITALDHRERLLPFVVVEGGTAERLGLIELSAAWRRAGADREVS
jgi:hypothetical protein